jgi:hypothetical protein
VTVAVAERIAREREVKYLLVEMPGGQFAAICLHHLRSAPPDAKVRDRVCDASSVGPLQPQLTLDQAAEIMRERAFRCLPVQVAGVCLGVVTGGDLRRAGMPSDLVTPVCVACGIRFHVRLDPETCAAPFCLECLERARPPSPFEDIGVGD